VKKVKIFLVIIWIAAMIAPVTYAQMKYVAVVETEVDEQSGAAAKLNKAEVRLITTELRSVAVKTLPRDKYNIMTSETVMSQGSAKLEECVEENCVIALGAKIGADYIVRGIVSKLGTNLTMSVEMYETNDGNLVATSGVVRSGNTAELLDKAAAACTDMYKTFIASQSSPPKTPVTRVAPVTPEKHEKETQETHIPPQTQPPVRYNAQETDTVKEVSGGRDYETAPKRKPMTGFLLGCNFFPGDDGGHAVFQLGFVHSRPVSEKIVSLNIEGNIQIGSAYYRDDDDHKHSCGVFGLNVPVTVLLQLNYFSIEAGVNGDVLSVDEESFFNAGFVIGAGVGFSEKHSRRYFYRYCGGYNYGAHVVGVRWLF